MLGFAWLTIRQAEDAVKCGRFEEAHRLLCQPAAHGHKRTGELLRDIARGLVERGQNHLQHNDVTAAWNDLAAAEEIGFTDPAAARLRQALVRRGLDDARNRLEAGDPDRAAETLAELAGRGVNQPEMQSLDGAARAWKLAREQANRGEFAQALRSMGHVSRLLPITGDAKDRFVTELEQRQRAFGPLLVQLHDAAECKRWGEVVELSEMVLALAPQHEEARKARGRAWKVVEPVTVAVQPSSAGSSSYPAAPTEPPRQRFLLWIDGVGGYLVCLDNRVTLGQATTDTYVDIPLFADVSRNHATITRDSEGYVVEAARALRVNGQATAKALLCNTDRITLGSACQIQFRQPVPVSASARLDLVSGHRLQLAVDGVLLMADTLVLGPGTHVHVAIPDLKDQIVLFRTKDGLGIRHAGEFQVDGRRCRDRATLGAACAVVGEDFSLSVEPVGARLGKV